MLRSGCNRLGFFLGFVSRCVACKQKVLEMRRVCDTLGPGLGKRSCRVDVILQTSCDC